jgi:hypothetical protein
MWLSLALSILVCSGDGLDFEIDVGKTDKSTLLKLLDSEANIHNREKVVAWVLLTKSAQVLLTKSDDDKQKLREIKIKVEHLSGLYKDHYDKYIL